MSESSLVFDSSGKARVSAEKVHPSGERGKRKPQRQQPRQLLSCTKCRERKVKCDRTKPCSACCARGQPRGCEFIAEGGDYAPIQQSYELKKLRAENLKLKERLRACKVFLEDDEDGNAGSPDSQHCDGSTPRLPKRRSAKQQRFQGPEWTDSIYFGSPGLANVVNEFASMNVAPSATYAFAHLSHAMPRGADMYAPRDGPLYPFPTLFPANSDECIPQLIGLLPQHDHLFGYLDSFQKRVYICSFPHVLSEITKSEVERFLSDPHQNIQKCPDMLALLFAALALGCQHAVWDECGGKWEPGAMQHESHPGNVYITAAMQALRMASFMSRPTLLGIQALIMMGPYLTNSGRFLDAWTLFGTTIRLAQSIGLHRNPKYLDPAPPTPRECHIRQTLWWWMLHMDQQYSMTLGRPLGISGIGDCPPPYELTTDQTFLRYGDFVNQFTVLARHILSSGRLSTAKIDEFTDSLRKLLDTMPEMLQFDERWLNKSTEIPEWPLGAMAAVSYCKIHTYLILLNRQRHDKRSGQSLQTDTPRMSSKASPVSFQAVNQASSLYSSPASSTPITLRGRALVLSSCEDVLTAFLFFYQRTPAALVDWTLGQQAFNACMILILDALETGNLGRLKRVEKAFVVFVELDNNGVHKLANLAVEKISWGLKELKRMQDGASSRGEDKINAASSRRCSHASESTATGAVGSEAVSYSGTIHDIVMGNTSMLLLEDPGLQSFVQEQFSPLTWVMAGDDLAGIGRTASVSSKRLEEDAQGARNTSARANVDADMNGPQNRILHAAYASRSPERARRQHGVQRSDPGSEKFRYTTLSSPATQGCLRAHTQTQGLLSPTPILPACPTTMADHQSEARARRVHTASGARDRVPPPHLRHNSYPPLPLQHVPSPLSQHPPHTSAGYPGVSPHMSLHMSPRISPHVSPHSPGHSPFFSSPQPFPSQYTQNLAPVSSQPHGTATPWTTPSLEGSIIGRQSLVMDYSHNYHG